MKRLNANETSTELLRSGKILICKGSGKVSWFKDGVLSGSIGVLGKKVIGPFHSDLPISINATAGEFTYEELDYSSGFAMERQLKEKTIIAASGISCTASNSVANSGQPVVLARIPVPAGTISVDSVLELLVCAEKAGSAGGWGLAAIVVAPGASTGTTIFQQFPTNVTLYSVVDFAALIGPTLKTMSILSGNLPATGVSSGQSTSGFSVSSVDFTVDREIIIVAYPASSGPTTCDRVTLRGFTLSVTPSVLSIGTRLIVTYGDSLTFGTGATTGMDYPNQLSRLRGIPVVNLGVGGETAAQVGSRVVLGSKSLGVQPSIFQYGRNNINGAASNASVIDEIIGQLKQSISTLDHDKYLIGSVTPAYATEIIGTTARTQIIAVNAAIANEFSRHYVDTLTPLATNAGEIPAANYTGVPNSAEVHLSDAGYGIVAAAYDAKMTALGW